MLRSFLIFLVLCLSHTSLYGNIKAFGSLEFGDPKGLVGKKLKSSKLVETKLDESLMGRTGLNGIYFLKKAVGDLKCSLYFRWSKENTLKELSMQSQSVQARKVAKVRKCWSTFVAVLTKRHGEAKSLGNFPDLSELKDTQIQTTHSWKSEDGRSFVLGIGNDQGFYSVAVIVRPVK